MSLVGVAEWKFDIADGTATDDGTNCSNAQDCRTFNLHVGSDGWGFNPINMPSTNSWRLNYTGIQADSSYFITVTTVRTVGTNLVDARLLFTAKPNGSSDFNVLEDGGTNLTTTSTIASFFDIAFNNISCFLSIVMKL